VQLNENEPGPKTARYFSQTRDGKLLLRKVLARHVPPEVADGVKLGFSGPDASWFKGDSIEYVKRRLLNRSARIYDVLDGDTVIGLVNEHLVGAQNRRLLIWSLLNLESWCECFL
jgi:asparagine synthase (glutamine-hydrolysing)